MVVCYWVNGKKYLHILQMSLFFCSLVSMRSILKQRGQKFIMEIYKKYNTNNSWYYNKVALLIIGSSKHLPVYGFKQRLYQVGTLNYQDKNKFNNCQYWWICQKTFRFNFKPFNAFLFMKSLWTKGKNLLKIWIRLIITNTQTIATNKRFFNVLCF